MKTKAIGDIIRKSGLCNLHISPNSNGEGVIQYVGNTYSLYALDGMPRLTKEAACSIFDVPTEKREGFNWFETDIVDIIMCEKENFAAEKEPVSIVWRGHERLVFNCDGTIVMIHASALKPIQDEMDDIEFFYREINPEKEAYAILALRGVEIRAFLCEVKHPDDVQYVDSLGAISRSAAISYGQAQMRREGSMDGQTRFGEEDDDA
jgi:hypothetical protein